MAESVKIQLDAAARGDTDALSALLKRFGPEVRRQLSISGRWQAALDVDDVMQVTYLEAFVRIREHSFDGQASFASWLRRVAENNLRDAIRALERLKRPPPSKRVAAMTYDDSAEHLIEQLGVTTTTPSRYAAAGELSEKLDAVLEALPEDYAQAVRLYDLEHKSIDETAEHLGRSRGAVHMLRARAHERLRELLGPESAFFSTGA